MRSSRKPPDGPPPTFFVDRGLGRYAVPAVLRRSGLTVVHMSELYDDDGQFVTDDQWIADVSARGWIALTKDTAIVRDHTAVLNSSSLRVFALPSASITGDAMAARFRDNLNRIIQYARKPGPYVTVVHPNRLERRWPANG